MRHQFFQINCASVSQSEHLLWGSGGTAVSPAGIVCPCGQFPLKALDTQVQTQVSFPDSKKFCTRFHKLLLEKLSRCCAAPQKAESWKLQTGFLQTLSHEPLPFANFVLCHFAITMKTRSPGSCESLWPINSSEDGLGTLNTLSYSHLRHQKGRCTGTGKKILILNLHTTSV